MGRIRTIKPEFPQSQSMGRCTRDARLLFILLWTLVDDSGRTRASSRMLASLLYPYDEDSRGLVDSWLAELEREECVRRYTVGGDEYLEVLNWLSHQKIDRPSRSKFPSFDEASTKAREGSTSIRRATHEGSRGLDERSTGDQGPRKGRDQGEEGIEEARAHDQDLPDQTGKANLKDLVVSGSLEEQGKDKSSLSTEGEEAEKIITPSCEISGNRPHLRATETMQVIDSKDESGDAPVPRIAQRERVEPPAEGKAWQNQPSAVILDNWPADVDRSEAARNLLRAHPRPAMGWGAVTAVIDQVKALAKERGESQWDAYNWLRGRVEAYKAATDKWPAEEKSFITGVLNWLTNEEYRHDDAIWSRGGGEGNNTFLDAIIQNVLVEGRSTEPGGGAPTPVLDSESIRRKREIARAGSLGPRPGFAHRRTF